MKMNVDFIKETEKAMCSKYVHLFFDKEVGFYVAYGLSAYLVCRVVDPMCSYSSSLELPVALLNRTQINICRRSLEKLAHIEQKYYKFQMNFSMPKDKNYENWVEKLKKSWL